MKSNAIVPRSMPPITPIARDFEPFEPTPEANIIGSNPSIIVAEVIIIGLRRCLAANSAEVFIS